MALPDRANNVLALLISDDRLKTGEIAFVAHSFGGLVVEQLLRLLADRSPTDLVAAGFLRRVRRIVFLGTPHKGADLATLGSRLRFFARLSDASEGLARNDPNLRELNQWYRGYAPNTGIETLTLFETRKTGLFGHVVKPDSADPGLPSPPIPVDADHYGICSPRSRDSETYKHVRDFLTKPLSLVQQTSSGLNTATAVAQIVEATQALASGLAKQTIPRQLVDAEVERRLSLLRKTRFFFGSAPQEEAARLMYDLLDGQLAVASQLTKRALAWCARILIGQPDKSKGIEGLEAAKKLGKSEEISIAEALVESYENRLDEALTRLAQISTPAARSVAFLSVANAKGVSSAFEWFSQSGLQLHDLDADGKFFVLQKQIETGAWDPAAETAKLLQTSDFVEAPILKVVAANAFLAQAVPQELRMSALLQVPVDAAAFPLFSDSAALVDRRKARDLYESASRDLDALGRPDLRDGMADRALWLDLRDPDAARNARITLETSMRDQSQALRRLPLALQFGLKLDLDAVEREIERQTVISGGGSVEAAIARLTLALTKSPREAANYIDKHRIQLNKHLNPDFVTAVEIQALATAGEISTAETRVSQLQNDLERTRLSRVIAEAKGENPREIRLAQFEKTKALVDLVALIGALEEAKDWPRLVEFGRILFERTRDISGCSLYARALAETGRYDKAISLLTQNQDLLVQSTLLESLLAWCFYQNGDLERAKNTLASVRNKRDTRNERDLLVSIGVASGDWNSLLAFVEDEWARRDQRDAEELLRAAQLALHLGSSRCKDLLFAAAEKAPDNPEILMACYSAAVSARLEDQAAIAGWLERAAALSGEKGPVKTVSLRELVDMQPEWQRRQSETLEKLQAGLMPIFVAAHLLNRSLVDLFVLPALRNREQVDPRRRDPIYAFSGARGAVVGAPKMAAFDATSLLTVSLANVFEDLLAIFDKIVVPHSTLGWLFEEQQRLRFHQPSRMLQAREIRGLLDSGTLKRFEPHAAPNSDLAQEVGDDLAALIVEAESDTGDDGRPRVVIRSAPVHRASSLMEEEADLSAHVGVLRSCTAVIDLLKTLGHLTQAEEQRARAYMSLREKSWPEDSNIRTNSILYLDGLSVTYLQHLGILNRLQLTGCEVVIPYGVIEEADALLRYENLLSRGEEILERLRAILNQGIANGKILVAPVASSDVEGIDEGLRRHPTMGVVHAAHLVDVVVIDDRSLNRLGSITSGEHHTPVWTTLDLLTGSCIPPQRQEEFLTLVRKSGFFFVPISTSEVTALLEQAPVSSAGLTETAELRAIRENCLMIRMTDALQIGTENVWLARLLQSLTEALRQQWHDGMNDEVARARSDWILDQIDIRGWSHRFGAAHLSDQFGPRYRAQILSLAMVTSQVSPDTKEKYWGWLEDRLLNELKENNPSEYVGIAEQIRTIIKAAADGTYGSPSQ